ncbi:MAG: hypothetical protein KF809_09705 [Chloroflexi bacterium]|nr:hypothetical protein [Chloroflexota bacterium]
MPIGAVILVDDTLPSDGLDGWRQAARDFSRATGLEARLMTGDEAGLTTLTSSLAAQADRWATQSLEDGAAAPPQMTAAPFEWTDDGRPDWARMWTSFCELALYGGPPHRGPDDPVRAEVSPIVMIDAGFDAVAEIRRGILETTGLFAEPMDEGWLAVTCDDPRMAAWLCASIILENVDARCDDDLLLVPARPEWTLQDQVKSVVTVVAKTHHYWAAHVAAAASAA